MQHHRAALGEAGEDNAAGVDAAVALRFQQLDHLLRRGFQLLAVDGPGRAHGQDVVPAGHGVAAIDGHCPGRRLGQDETAIGQTLLQGLGHRQEVVTVGAQAVQPDDTGVGSMCGLKDQGFVHRGSAVVRVR